MPISPQTIFNRVTDLSRKDKSGYMSADEFNRNLQEAQNMLMAYYYYRFEQEQEFVDNLNPFVVEVVLPIAISYVSLPLNYRHRLQLAYLYIQNENCPPTPVPSHERIVMHYCSANEEALLTSSAIRRPNLSTKSLHHTFINNKIRVLPRDLLGFVELKYLRDPVRAIYAITLDVANDQENYDPINSVDLEWEQQDTNNIVDIMLIFQGISSREDALFQFVQQRLAIQKK
jgi:hypothetical protein